MCAHLHVRGSRIRKINYWAESECIYRVNTSIKRNQLLVLPPIGQNCALSLHERDAAGRSASGRGGFESDLLTPSGLARFLDFYNGRL